MSCRPYQIRETDPGHPSGIDKERKVTMPDQDHQEEVTVRQEMVTMIQREILKTVVIETETRDQEEEEVMTMTRRLPEREIDRMWLTAEHGGPSHCQRSSYKRGETSKQNRGDRAEPDRVLRKDNKRETTTETE